MDIFSHLLWTFILFYRTRLIGLSLLFSILPDLLSWGIYSIYRLSQNIPFGPPNLAIIPDWTFTLYGITHSLFIFAAVAIILKLTIKHIPIFIYPWLLNILFDIPTHSREFLPTPFLWPFNYYFPGISWGQPSFILTNYLTIFILIIITLYLNKNLVITLYHKLRPKLS